MFLPYPVGIFTKETVVKNLDGLLGQLAAQPLHPGLSAIDPLDLMAIAQRRARAGYAGLWAGVCVLALAIGVGGAVWNQPQASAIEYGLAGPPPLAPSILLAPDA